MSAVTIPVAPFRRRVGLLVRVMREADRKLAAIIFTTLVLSSIAGAMQSVALKWLVDASIDRRWGFAVAAAVVGGLGAGLLGSAGRAMFDVEQVVTNQVGLLIDRHTLELTAGMPGIEHLERPEYLDQVALVRKGGASLMRAVFALTGTASLAISMGTGLWLLAGVDPWLLLVPLFAVPTAVLVPRSERHVDKASGIAAERQRAATQLTASSSRPRPPWSCGSSAPRTASTAGPTSSGGRSPTSSSVARCGPRPSRRWGG